MQHELFKCENPTMDIKNENMKYEQKIINYAFESMKGEKIL